MKKPAPVLILSILAVLNGGVTLALGMITLLGSRLLFTPGGYGPNRVAIAHLLGPLSAQAGWVMLALGGIFILVGYGLFTLREWARLTLFWVFAVLASATLVAVGWGVYHGELGVVLSGLLKVGVEVALCLYLAAPGVRCAFVR